MPKRERVDAFDPFNDWLPVPVLWDGERKEDYLELYGKIESEMSPANLFDRIRVQDLTDKLWQEARLKRMQAALVMSARVESLTQLLSARFGDNIDEARETAQDYYSGISERVRKVGKLLGEMGVTVEQIEANALHLRSAGIQALDRMTTYKEATRNGIMKGHEKRLRRAERDSKKNPLNDNAVERVPRIVKPRQRG